MGTIFIQQKNRSIPVLCFVTKIHHFSIKEMSQATWSRDFLGKFPPKIAIFRGCFL
jgi:hypothetical protein